MTVSPAECVGEVSSNNCPSDRSDCRLLCEFKYPLSGNDPDVVVLGRVLCVVYHKPDRLVQQIRLVSEKPLINAFRTTTDAGFLASRFVS